MSNSQADSRNFPYVLEYSVSLISSEICITVDSGFVSTEEKAGSCNSPLVAEKTDLLC